jgi:Predicted nucleic acid-binding protein, contains PIN domain
LAILIDSSVWINFFKGVSSPAVKTLENLIEREEDVGISDIILTEILQGFRDDKEYRFALDHLLSFSIYTLKDTNSYIKAAQIYRACRKNGITIRKTIDCLIAQIAIENGLVLLHEDVDFDRIATVCPLNVYSI